MFVSVPSWCGITLTFRILPLASFRCFMTPTLTSDSLTWKRLTTASKRNKGWIDSCRACTENMAYLDASVSSYMFKNRLLFREASKINLTNPARRDDNSKGLSNWRNESCITSLWFTNPDTVTVNSTAIRFFLELKPQSQFWVFAYLVWSGRVCSFQKPPFSVGQHLSCSVETWLRWTLIYS